MKHLIKLLPLMILLSGLLFTSCSGTSSKENEQEDNDTNPSQVQVHQEGVTVNTQDEKDRQEENTKDEKVVNVQLNTEYSDDEEEEVQVDINNQGITVNTQDDEDAKDVQVKITDQGINIHSGK